MPSATVPSESDGDSCIDQTIVCTCESVIFSVRTSSSSLVELEPTESEPGRKSIELSRASCHKPQPTYCAMHKTTTGCVARHLLRLALECLEHLTPNQHRPTVNHRPRAVVATTSVHTSAFLASSPFLTIVFSFADCCCCFCSRATAIFAQ